MNDQQNWTLDSLDLSWDVGQPSEVLARQALFTDSDENGVSADVTDPASVAALFETIKREFGRLDVLFNNAGTGLGATDFGDIAYENWLSVVNVNLNGMFLCANAAYRMMRDQSPQGGRIINNGSISAHSPRPGRALRRPEDVSS